jgi:hypothetical protein
VRFERPADLAALLPDGLAEPFTVRELAAALPATVLRAQRAAYVLRALGLIVPAGNRGRAPVYTMPVRRVRPARPAPASRRARKLPASA